MEGRIKPSPVLNAPPAKESDPFCTSATLLPLRPCRRNTFQKGEFPLHSHPPRARRNAASNRAFSFSQCAISARDLSSRASDLALDVRSVSFRASDEQRPRRFAPWRPLAAVVLVPFAGRPLSRVRRARAVSRVALCDLFSKSHVIHLSPAPL